MPVHVSTDDYTEQLHAITLKQSSCHNRRHYHCRERFGPTEPGVRIACCYTSSLLDSKLYVITRKVREHVNTCFFLSRCVILCLRACIRMPGPALICAHMGMCISDACISVFIFGVRTNYTNVSKSLPDNTIIMILYAILSRVCG